MLKYLLDTNIVSYVIKRRPVEVMGVFNQNAGRMAISAISAITLGEFTMGPRRAQRSRRTWP